MKPQDVHSPRQSWQLIEVLWDGFERDTSWSMAMGRWRDDDDERWYPRLALRWDGGAKGKGMPISTGHPVWFMVPEDMHGLLVDSDFVPLEKRPYVKAFLEQN